MQVLPVPIGMDSWEVVVAPTVITNHSIPIIARQRRVCARTLERGKTFFRRAQEKRALQRGKDLSDADKR